MNNSPFNIGLKEARQKRDGVWRLVLHHPNGRGSLIVRYAITWWSGHPYTVLCVSFHHDATFWPCS